MLNLLPLATVRITISQHTRVDGLPIGSRLVGEASACTVSGRVIGEQAGACTDWLTLHHDGSVSVDARLLLRTTSGAHLTIRYNGRGAALPATGAPVYVVPTFETDDPEYAWLNTIQAVGKGIRTDTSLEYELYELS